MRQLHDGIGGRPARWSAPARALHWIAAASLLTLLGLGLVMVNAPLGAATKFDLYQWHKALGVIVLPALVLRSLHRVMTGRPRPVASPAFAAAAARVVHASLHAVPLLMVVTGYLLAGASVIPIPITLPLGITVPLAGSPDLAREEMLKSIHHVLGFLLAALVGLHVAAALWHQIVLKDGLLTSMAPLVRRPRAAA